LFPEVDHVLDHRPQDAEVVEPFVLVEVRVLCRDESLDQPAGQLVDFDHLSPFEVELAHQDTVVPENLGYYGWFVVGKPVDLGQGNRKVIDVGNQGDEQNPSQGQKYKQNVLADVSSRLAR